MKTSVEWLQAFNLLYNNIASDKAPGLEPYEISYFLTTAQDNVVISLYSGSYGKSFEASEEVTDYLSTLVRQQECKKILPSDDITVISDKSVLFANPNDLLFRTLEFCTIKSDCGEDVQIPVVPVTQDEYFRTVRNPFKKQNKRRALRLAFSKCDLSQRKMDDDSKTSQSDIRWYSEIVSDFPILTYTVRYISRPTPIIVDNLPDSLEINGCSKASTCTLPEALHNTILAKAVELAKATWAV